VPTRLNLGEFAKAEESLQKADALTDFVLVTRPRDAAALLLSAGIAHDRMILANSERRNADAKAYAAKVVERLERWWRAGAHAQDRSDAADCYANVALFHMNVHLYDDAVRYARRSIEVAAGDPTEQRTKATSLSIIGSSLRSEGRLEEALDALREARAIAEGPVFGSKTERALNLYGILLREARTLGNDRGVNLGRPEEAIAVYEKAVEITGEAASTDPRDQTSRDRFALSARELADLLVSRDPRRALDTYDQAIRRLREISNNLAARRREAQTLAASSNALRRLGRMPEARQRIDSALQLLRQTHDYPSGKIPLDSEVAGVLLAQAELEAAAGDPRLAVRLYEQLLTAVNATNPDPFADLSEAVRLSALYYVMAGAYRRAGDPAKASATDIRRQALWRQWNTKLPQNAYVGRELARR
jgi:tetratricopeptide (TPR) repeat protein